MQHIILLTGCINPNGMPFTSLTDNSVRKEHYLNAITYYLHNTDFPIVFAENSGTDISNHFQESIADKRLEVLTFNANKNKERGKGYGEAEIIDYAFENSHIIASNNKKCSIIKITGRLIVNNITKLVCKSFFLQESDGIIVSFNSSFTLADSRVIIAPYNFYNTFLQHKEDINDTAKSYFEVVLSYSIKNNTTYHYYPFFIEPQITGQSGTTGEQYVPHNNGFHRRMEYLTYVFSQILYFNNNLSNHKFSLFKRATYSAILLFLKIANKFIRIYYFF